ncbi:MAG: hypothetical protein B9S32_04060 [Verrucomicrobia bacterium Tous-C9LFEB]|nr:MAG: hypothetical protein B9S32_04060 [Verrucomicrobia bacterium Tous-C9LFEB]
MNQSPSENWKSAFRSLFNLAVDHYRSGKRGAANYFKPAEIAELATFGYRAQEMYDFAEDRVKYGEPDLETALAIAGVRREYFLQVQGGKLTDQRIDMASLPPKDASVAGIVWLPRILVKAKAKLRGEMPDDLMYGCGGDRKFFKENNVDPVKFLRAVWKANGDDQAVIDFVRQG